MDKSVETTFFFTKSQFLSFDFSNSPQVVDGRPKGRFEGTAPEPNPTINSGHMLGSINMPFTEIVNKDTMTMKSQEDLRKWTICGWYVYVLSN